MTNVFLKSSLDFSSQYGSERSFSYTARNCLGTPSRFPSYGDYPQTYVPRFIPHFEQVLLLMNWCISYLPYSFSRVLLGNFALKYEIRIMISQPNSWICVLIIRSMLMPFTFMKHSILDLWYLFGEEIAKVTGKICGNVDQTGRSMAMHQDNLVAQFFSFKN